METQKIGSIVWSMDFKSQLCRLRNTSGIKLVLSPKVSCVDSKSLEVGSIVWSTDSTSELYRVRNTSATSGKFCCNGQDPSCCPIWNSHTSVPCDWVMWMSHVARIMSHINKMQSESCSLYYTVPTCKQVGCVLVVVRVDINPAKKRGGRSQFYRLQKSAV